MSWRSVLAIRVGKPLGASAAVSSDTRAAIMPGKLVRSFLSARLEGDMTEHNGVVAAKPAARDVSSREPHPVDRGPPIDLL